MVLAIVLVVIGAMAGAGWMLACDTMDTSGKGSLTGFIVLLPILAGVAFVLDVLAGA